MSIELPSPRWLWEKTNPDRGGAAGDLGKLFKNTRINQPDLLEDGAPPPTATLLAREVIQNAWDSALERREEYEKLIAGDPASAPPPPQIFGSASTIGTRRRRPRSAGSLIVSA